MEDNEFAALLSLMMVSDPWALSDDEDRVLIGLLDAPKIVGMNAPMLAVCAKASYTQDRAKINRFLQVMRTGIVEGDHESAAIRLRDFGRSLRGASNHAVREETHNKTMSALSHFLEGKPMSKLYGTATDLFPILAKTDSF